MGAIEPDELTTLRDNITKPQKNSIPLRKCYADFNAIIHCLDRQTISGARPWQEFGLDQITEGLQNARLKDLENDERKGSTPNSTHQETPSKFTPAF